MKVMMRSICRFFLLKFVELSWNDEGKNWTFWTSLVHNSPIVTIPCFPNLMPFLSNRLFPPLVCSLGDPVLDVFTDIVKAETRQENFFDILFGDDFKKGQSFKNQGNFRHQCCR